MSKEIYISSTPHETRLAIVENDDLTEIYYERENEYTLAGSIYNGKVTRVLPGMQSSFVDIGLERDAFLYITDFMEEAGDSAEFDSGDGSSGSRRGTREERPRNDANGPRTEDRGARDLAAPLRDDAGSAQNRPAAASPEAHSDRGDREGGRRRRGNRDGRGGNREARGGNSEDRGGNRDQSPESRTDAAIEPIFDLPPVVQSGYTQPGADIASADVGEGAPGADGSRRWRGRRGRRRGRTSSQREEAQVLQQPVTPLHPDDAAPGQSVGYQPGSANVEQAEENFDQEYADSFDLDAAAAHLPPSPVAPAPSDSNTPPTSQLTGSDETRRRDRRDRGDREPRDRNRHDRDQRIPRAPRGFAPSRALYGVDSTVDADLEAQAAGTPAPEPLILPGESLSKYRKGDHQQTAASSSPAIAPPPSTEYNLKGVWDGSAVLPGETLRPRSNTVSDSGSSGRMGSDRHQDSRGLRDRGGRDSRDDRRGGRNERAEGRRESRPDNRPGSRPEFRTEIYSDSSDDLNRSVTHAPQETAPAPSLNQAPLPSQPTVPSGISLHASSTDEVAPAAQTSSDIAQAASNTSVVAQEPLEHHASDPETQPDPTEYEPTEASASVRFDSTTRSEFRQSSPFAEPLESFPADALNESAAFAADSSLHVEEVHADTSAPADPQLHFQQGQPLQETSYLHSIAHTITPQPEAPVTPLHIGAPLEDPATHEFTSIAETGEMQSESPAPPQGEVSEPTSPLHHETAVLDSVSQAVGSVQTPSGLLEEETMDEEEDFNATTLHASSIEEMDYEEEETLEGAADLGTMIRDMSIDQITSTGADPEEEDDILEEEDAVDDHLDHAYEEIEDDEDEPHTQTQRAISDESAGSTSSPSHDEYAVSGQATEIDATRNGSDLSRDPERRSSRRDGGGRRDGRRGDRDGRGRDRGPDRARPTGGSGDRSTGRPGRRDGRHSAQSTNLPAISDLLKPGQEVLIQIAKEPMAKKGARITSHIALPGRFLVFMPTVHHTGVSRKIESDSERRRLKEILLSEKGEAAGGFIVRTAASGASEEELRSDLRFLLNLWADIKQRSESSKSPALIYHDLNLVERILRDQVTDTFSAIWVDTESEYERVLRFLQRFQPSLIRRVKLYTKETPLFEQFGLTEEINKALRSKVWLKSGGSIVINQTEALVAIDINTGKYVGKTARLEDTIVKTNLDAIPEIVRQIRLRDLGGIIIIDFIDMDERKNRNKVMAALEEELKKDRAPSKVLQFNDFGLVAITRKRVKQSLERTLSTTCNVCQGTGMTKSPVTVCNDIYIEMRKMQKHLDRGDIMLRVNPEVVKQLKSTGSRWLQEMEEMAGKTILVKSDPSLHPEQFDIH